MNLVEKTAACSAVSSVAKELISNCSRLKIYTTKKFDVKISKRFLNLRFHKQLIQSL